MWVKPKDHKYYFGLANRKSVNSYKDSDLAKQKTVSIVLQGKDLSVVLATTKTKKQNKPDKPATLVNKSVPKRDLTKMAKTVFIQILDSFYIPDLKKATLVRLSVVYRSLRVLKSCIKKRTRQSRK